MVFIGNKEYPEYTYDYIQNNHFGYIYVTVNNLNGKKYIGLSYATKNDNSYLGSGTYLKTAIKHYGKNNFSKYVVDYADSLEELEILEVKYITEKFGTNVTKSADWYNINDGKQRGGNTWSGLSDEDREKRIEKFRHTRKANNHIVSSATRELMSYNTYNRFKDPEERLKTSIATKKAMNSIQVKKKLLGKKHKEPDIKYKDHLNKIRHRIGTENIKNLRNYYETHEVWNKGKKFSKEERIRQSERSRKRYNIIVYYNDVYKKNFIQVVSATSIDDLSLYLRYNKIVNIGKNSLSKLVSQEGKLKISEYLSLEITIKDDYNNSNTEIIIPAKYYEYNKDIVYKLDASVYRVSIKILSEDGKYINKILYWKNVKEINDYLYNLTGVKISMSVFAKLKCGKKIGKYKIIEWEKYKL